MTLRCSMWYLAWLLLMALCSRICRPVGRRSKRRWFQKVRASRRKRAWHTHWPMPFRRQSLWPTIWRNASLSTHRCSLYGCQQFGAVSVGSQESASGPERNRPRCSTHRVRSDCLCGEYFVFYPAYVRGQAYLAAQRDREANAEFQTILNHGGIVWNFWTGSLAIWESRDRTPCTRRLDKVPTLTPPGPMLSPLTKTSSHSGKTPTPTSRSRSKPRPSTRSRSSRTSRCFS